MSLIVHLTRLFDVKCKKELLDFDDDDDRTIVFITHDMNEAFLIGDKVALMKDGEVIQVGKPEDFLTSRPTSM